MLNEYKRAKTYIIPGWVYRAIVRNKLNLIDIIDYSKIRSILSIDDMASWVYLNDIYRLRKESLTLDCLITLFNGLNNEELLEYNASIKPLSGMEITSQRLHSNLSDTNDMTESVPYTILNISDLILIVLNEGFESMISDSESLLNFIRDYLKGHNKVNTLSDVSNLPLYGLYIGLI